MNKASYRIDSSGGVFQHIASSSPRVSSARASHSSPRCSSLSSGVRRFRTVSHSNKSISGGASALPGAPVGFTARGMSVGMYNPNIFIISSSAVSGASYMENQHVHIVQ